MNRPVYENATTLEREGKLLDIFIENYHVLRLQPYAIQMCKLPISYRLDFGIFHYESGELVGLAELKCRNYNFGDFSTFSISAGKFNAAIQLQQSLDVPVYFVVGWKDKNVLYTLFPDYTKVGKEKFVTKWGGRHDRDDIGDMEPMVHIPNNHFREIINE